ncbi:MAG TPA: hypothetical protein VGB75_01490 [Jatrophihabitans sp.]|uniref:hypothetical protein n=1 Tax=Jatrophihabitans sp. TaxID=1932789 RepID=UPI002F2098AC
MPNTAARATEAYLNECAQPGSRLRHLMTEVDVSVDWLKSWRVAARPLIADEAELRAFGDDLAAVFGLLTELPARCFDGDLGRFCEFLGIDERRAALMRRLGDAPPPMYGRSDMYHDGAAYRLLEFNVGSPVGGMEMAELLGSAMLRVPAFAQFAAEHGLRQHDTGADIALTLREAAKPVAVDDPVVAILEAPGGLTAYGHRRQALADQLMGHGLTSRVGELSDLEFVRGKPHLDGTPIDLILRYFGLEEMLAHPEGEALLEPVFRAHQDGAVVLWTPFSSNPFGNKGTLALLSERAADAATFTPAERSLIERLVPWSRVLGRPGTAVDRRLIEECRERREELVLKPTGLSGGQGVVVGRYADPRRWREVIEAGAATGALVQQEVRPNEEGVIDPQTGERQDWRILWGAFVTPNGLAGGLGRMVPPGGDGVISNSADPNTRSTCVFLR